MRLAASDVTVRYPGASTAALDRVSCALGAGEFVVVAGPNGSGKSTAFRALLGMQAITSGMVTLDDEPIGAWPRARLARRVAALPQREEPAFALSVHEAVGLGRWARLGPFGRLAAADHAALERAMTVTRLREFADRGIDTLSGGEWQRVRLARALAAEPELLLLDEPGTALDLAHEMALYELLATLVRGGLGVLAITHHLNAALRYADRVILLDHGRVAADGTPAAALTAARLSQIFEWPIAVDTRGDGSLHIVPLRRTDADDAMGSHSPTEVSS
jgi:iron complex transport system ATP-binding protein